MYSQRMYSHSELFYPDDTYPVNHGSSPPFSNNRRNYHYYEKVDFFAPPIIRTLLRNNGSFPPVRWCRMFRIHLCETFVAPWSSYLLLGRGTTIFSLPTGGTLTLPSRDVYSSSITTTSSTLVSFHIPRRIEASTTAARERERERERERDQLREVKNFNIDGLHDPPRNKQGPHSSSAECNPPGYDGSSPDDPLSSIEQEACLSSFDCDDQEDTMRKHVRNVVGEGLVPRRRSLVRSDCREGNELVPALQFSRRALLSRSDHKTISCYDDDDIHEDNSGNTSPERGWSTCSRSYTEASAQPQMDTTNPSDVSLSTTQLPSITSLVGSTNHLSSRCVDQKSSRGHHRDVPSEHSVLCDTDLSRNDGKNNFDD